MKVLHHNGLGFLMIRKSCTTSLKHAFMVGMGLKPKGSIHRDRRLNYCHHSDFDGDLYGIVRDPRSRVLSVWQNKIHDQYGNPGSSRYYELGVPKGCSFSHFIELLPEIYDKDGHLAPLTLPKKATLIRYESVGDEWPKIREKHHWLPKLGVYNTTDPKAAYTPETLAVVESLYKDDIALWESL